MADWAQIGPAMQGINLKLMAEEETAREQKALASGDSTESIDDISVLIADGDDASTNDISPDSISDSLGSDLENQLSTADSTSALDSLDLQISNLFQLLQVSPYGMYADLRDTSRVNDYINRDDVKALLPPNTKLLWAVKSAEAQEGSSNTLLELFAIKTQRGGKAPLTGEVITNAWQDYDEGGRPAVYMAMNSTGGRKWAAMTSSAASAGTRIAIVLDNYVYSAPGVEEEIPNGSSVISGNFTIEEAADLGNVLKAGALPAPTKIVQEAIIGPTLGKEAQSQGINSILLGLGVVVIFMIFYYARGGFVANLALLFNVFFILGVLAQLNAALTLPGAAGIVLTIGMAIDANVLIFERIREELRNGSKLKAAINTGYKKAYSSIIDANVTTFPNCGNSVRFGTRTGEGICHHFNDRNCLFILFSGFYFTGNRGMDVPQRGRKQDEFPYGAFSRFSKQIKYRFPWEKEIRLFVFGVVHHYRYGHNVYHWRS